jgi:O-antigen ligase/tetratricopeptide (TPR) repeat protein
MRQNLSISRPEPAALLLPPLLVLAPLIFARWTLEAFTYNKAVLLQLMALAIVVLINPKRLWAAWRETARDPAAVGALLFAVSAIVSTMTSISPRTSLQGAPDSYASLGTVLSYLVVFFAARAVFASTGGIRTVASAAAIAAAGTATYAVLQAIHLEPMEWVGISKIEEFVRPFGTSGHPNFLGGYLAMVLPLLLYLIAQAKGERKPLLVWILVTGLAVAGVILSLSRAAWLAAICGVVVLALTMRLRMSRKWLISGLLIAVVGLLVLTTTPFGEIFATGVLGRLRSLAEGEGRYQIWRSAWLIFLDHPWVGSGLDTFQMVFGSRQTADYWHQEWGITPTRAHNEFLHVLATQGLLGGLALLVWIGGLILAGVRAWRRAAPGDRLGCAAVVAALVAFVVQVQFGFVEPGSGTLAAGLAGVLAGLGTLREPAAGAARSALPIHIGAGIAVIAFAANAFVGSESLAGSRVLAIATFGAVVALAAYAVAYRDTSRARWSLGAWLHLISPLELVARGGLVLVMVMVAFSGLIQPYLAECAARTADMVRDVDAAAEARDCQFAVDLAPGYALEWTRLAAITRLAAARESSSSTRLQFLRLALTAIDQAVALVPADPTNHANRGRILAAVSSAGGNMGDKALAEFDTAIAMAPRNLLFIADAGQTAIDCGQLKRARRYFQAGLAVDPSYGRFAAGLGATALAEGHNVEALKWLEQAHSLAWYEDHAGYERHFAQLAAAHLAAHDTIGAERWAREALTYHPEEAVPHWVLGNALEQQGNSTEAILEYRKVLGITPSWKPACQAIQRLGGTLP